jgi:hypothetical protein
MHCPERESFPILIVSLPTFSCTLFLQKPRTRAQQWRLFSVFGFENPTVLLGMHCPERESFPILIVSLPTLSSTLRLQQVLGAHPFPEERIS